MYLIENLDTGLAGHNHDLMITHISLPGAWVTVKKNLLESVLITKEYLNKYALGDRRIQHIFVLTREGEGGGGRKSSM